MGPFLMLGSCESLDTLDIVAPKAAAIVSLTSEHGKSWFKRHALRSNLDFVWYEPSAYVGRISAFARLELETTTPAGGYRGKATEARPRYSPGFNERAWIRSRTDVWELQELWYNRAMSRTRCEVRQSRKSIGICSALMLQMVCTLSVRVLVIPSSFHQVGAAMDKLWMSGRSREETTTLTLAHQFTYFDLIKMPDPRSISARYERDFPSIRHWG